MERNNGYNFGATLRMEQNKLIPQANTDIFDSFYIYDMTFSKFPDIFIGLIVNILESTAMAFLRINGLVCMVKLITCPIKASAKSLFAIVPKQLNVAEHSM